MRSTGESKKTGGHRAKRRAFSERQRNGVAIAGGVAILLGLGATTFFTMTATGKAQWTELHFVASALLQGDPGPAELAAARRVTDEWLAADRHAVPTSSFQREIEIAKVLPDAPHEVLQSQQRFADALWNNGQKSEAAIKYGEILLGTRKTVYQNDFRYYIPTFVIERASGQIDFCEAGAIFQNHAQDTPAVACYQRAIANGGRDRDGLMQARLSLAEIMLKRSKISDADAQTDAVLDMLAQSGYTKPGVLLGLANVAQSYWKMAQKPQANKLYDYIASQRPRFASLTAEAQANLLHDLATHFRQQEQPAKAQPLYEECIAVRRQNGITGKALSMAIFDAGDNLLSMNQPKKAEPFMEQALQLWEGDSEWKFDVNRDTKFDTIYCSVADTYFKNAKYDRSEKYFGRALDIWAHKPHSNPLTGLERQERDRLMIGLVDSVKHEPNGAMRGAQLAASFGYIAPR